MVVERAVMAVMVHDVGMMLVDGGRVAGGGRGRGGGAGVHS